MASCVFCETKRCTNVNREPVFQHNQLLYICTVLTSSLHNRRFYSSLGIFPPHLSPHNNSMGMVGSPTFLSRWRYLLWRTPKQYHSRHDVFLLRIGSTQSFVSVETVPDPSSTFTIYKCSYIHHVHGISALLLYRA